MPQLPQYLAPQATLVDLGARDPDPAYARKIEQVADQDIHARVVIAALKSAGQR